jgi:hypothetical protein
MPEPLGSIEEIEHKLTQSLDSKRAGITFLARFLAAIIPAKTLRHFDLLRLKGGTLIDNGCGEMVRAARSQKRKRGIVLIASLPQQVFALLLSNKGTKGRDRYANHDDPRPGTDPENA